VNGNAMLFLSSFAWVAAAVGAVIAAAWAIGGRRLPPKRPFPVAFTGIDVVLLTFGLIFADVISFAIVSQTTVMKRLLPVDVATESPAGLDVLGGLAIAEAQRSEITRTAIVGLVARILSAGVAVLIVLGHRLAANPLALRWAGPSTIGLAAVAWLVIAPTVLAISAFVSQLMMQWGGSVEVHPLSTIGGIPSLAFVFLVSACVATPIFEELLVRGIVLPWAVHDQRRSWLVIVPAAVFAFMGAKDHFLGVACFLAASVGLMAYVLQTQRQRTECDEIAAVLSTSILFASLHSSVWPTPIPLFVFSIGLGWLAVRTGGVTAPIIVHGLLNAVSAIYVLRGGASE
jgi:membrane protease YdiL (CAAX protease family)